jgi:hypothetical protein
MKMGFLLKNNARKGMGGKGVLKKGEEKECSKRGEEKGVLKTGEEKKAEKGLQNSRILKRMAGWAEIRKF